VAAVAPCPLSRTPMSIIILAETQGGSLFVFKSVVIIVANTIFAALYFILITLHIVFTERRKFRTL
jgi:hypothetical protein